MTKSFKMVLLEALLELDGLRQATPPVEHEDDVVVPQITVSGPNTLNEPLHVVASPRNK